MDQSMALDYLMTPKHLGLSSLHQKHTDLAHLTNSTQTILHFVCFPDEATNRKDENSLYYDI